MRSQDVPRDQWVSVLDQFSKQHEGWIVTVEVLGPTLGDQEEVTALPLVGITADVKNRDHPIEVIVGGRPDAHVTHVINKPRRLWLNEPEEPAHEAVAIESEDGTTTLVHFRHVPPGLGERQLRGPGRS